MDAVCVDHTPRLRVGRWHWQWQLLLPAVSLPLGALPCDLCTMSVKRSSPNWFLGEEPLVLTMSELALMVGQTVQTGSVIEQRLKTLLP